MQRQCKICQREVTPKHTVNKITFYYCPSCDFLQNYHWEEHGQQTKQQTSANNKRRAERWPAGLQSDMHRKGWETLELMFWPPAWFSRQLHRGLKKIPGYRQLTTASIIRRKPKLMDFGCGHGVLALELRRQDNLDILGLDPFSPTDNPNIVRTTLEAAHFPDNSFNGIITIETMEHISNILPTFRELQRILKPGGVLFIQTRRLEDADYQKQQEKWFYLEDPTTHVAIYSETALQRIAEKTGFAGAAFRGTRTARLWK